MRRQRQRPMHFTVHRLHDGTVLAAYPIRKPSNQELKQERMRIDSDGVAREFADGGRILSDVNNETRTTLDLTPSARRRRPIPVKHR